MIARHTKPDAHFVEIDGLDSDLSYQEPVSIGIFGEHGSGKTRFSVTGPVCVGVLPLDRKTRQTAIKTAKELGRKIILPEKEIFRITNPLLAANMKIEESKKFYREHVNNVKELAWRLRDRKDVKLIALDSGSQLWEDMLFAEFGRSQRIMPRDRGPVNQEMIDFLNSLADKHLVITHKAKEIWRNDKPSGEYEWAGFPHLGYHVNVLVYLWRKDKLTPREREDGDEGFRLDIKQCQANASLFGAGGLHAETGLVNDAITFSNLARTVYPESEEEWD